MNIERLFELALRIHNDYADTQILDTLRPFEAEIRNWISSPDNEVAKEAVEERLKFIQIASDKSVFNDMGPLDSRMVQHIGGSSFVAASIFKSIQFLIDDNGVDLLGAYQEYWKNLDVFATTISHLIDNMNELGVDVHSHSDDGSELTIIIPASNTDLLASDYNDIVHSWILNLGHVALIVGDSDEEIVVVDAGRGSLLLTLLSTVRVAQVVVTIVSAVLKLYESVMKLKNHIKQLTKDKVPKNLIDPIEQHVVDTLDAGLNEIAKSTIDTFLTNHDSLKGRAPSEAETSMKQVASFVLKQVDKGIQVDIYLPSPVASESDDVTKEDSEHSRLSAAASKEVNAEWARVNSLRSGDPVLAFEDTSDKGDIAEDDSDDDFPQTDDADSD